jgi:hypothetical protein
MLIYIYDYLINNKLLNSNASHFFFQMSRIGMK